MSLFHPISMLWSARGGHILAVTYGGELSYLQIWRSHRRDLRTLSYCEIHHAITIMHVWSLYIKSLRKGNSCLLGGFRYAKIRRYNKSAPYVTTRWRQQQIPPFNFLGMVLLVNNTCFSCLFADPKNLKF